MSTASIFPVAGDINLIRENYDTSNPVVAEILKAKEERLKILQEFNKLHQDDFDIKDLLLEKEKKSTIVKKTKKPEHNNSLIPVRRSTRLRTSLNVSYQENESFKQEPEKNKFMRPPNDYGAVSGVEVGTHWETRMECSLDGVHRPTVAGIHGGPDGAYSIALSGGYPEDIDEGDSFIYTGAGGRDLKGTATKPKNLRTAPQTRDQHLEGTNLSLVKSIESKLPVRVIRGYKSPSIFAPETGYRYDGLYQVMEYWEDMGKTGHKIFRFKMERIKDQTPPPWETSYKNSLERKTSKENEKLEKEFPVLNIDDSEFKENIMPDIEFSNPPGENSCTDVKDIENKIQMCIEFFCNSDASKFNDDLWKDGADEEFLGWD